MIFEFICDNGVFYTPLGKFLQHITGQFSTQVRSDFANRFHKVPLKVFQNLGANGRLYIRIDDLINQDMYSYEKSEHDKFNEFVSFCEEHLYKNKKTNGDEIENNEIKVSQPKNKKNENALTEIIDEIAIAKKKINVCSKKLDILLQERSTPIKRKKILGLF